MNQETIDSIHKQLNDQKLRVYLFNVSQGDHILLKLPNGEFGIIDFFYSGKGGLGQKAPPGIDFLKQIQKYIPEQEIKISFIYLSHPDRDHLYGIDKLLDWVEDTEKPIEVKQLWWFGGSNIRNYIFELKELADKHLTQEKDIEKKKNLRREHIMPFKGKLNRINEFIDNRKGITISHLTAFGKLCSLDEVKVYQKAPLPTHVYDFTDKYAAHLATKYHLNLPELEDRCDKNLVSSVVLMIFNNFKLLFGGDTHKDIWDQCFRQYKGVGFETDDSVPDYEAHFIKASHHGSKNSSSEDIWSRIIDTNVEHNIHIGFSAGFNYYHPSDETLNHISTVSKNIENCKIKIDVTNDASALRKLETDNGGYSENKLDWIFTDQDHPDPYTRVSMKGVRSNQKDEKDGLGNRQLAAFIYEFDKNQTEINVSIGVTTMLKDKRTKSKRRSYLPV